MEFRKVLTVLAIAVFGLLLGHAAPAEAYTKTFRDPMVKSRLLDGCYSWPGPCKSRKQANAFCRRKGFDFAVDYDAVNKTGTFKTKRLGDGGTCKLSCTVMRYVKCRSNDYDDDGENDHGEFDDDE